jgi:hypothetical protein
MKLDGAMLAGYIAGGFRSLSRISPSRSDLPLSLQHAEYNDRY